jgi:CheY-like chemotaxis protein
MAGLPAFLAGVAAGAVIAAAVASALIRRVRRRDAARLSMLAHDLRAPLSSITAFTEILLDDVSEKERYLAIIHEEALRLDRMIGERLGSPGSAAVAAAPPPLPSGRASPPNPKSGRRVLVVDDDSFIVEATRALLARAGFQAVGAAGGEEALRRARADHPDLILMDQRMPDITGGEALQRLRSDPATRDIPVIITTGDDDVRAMEGAAAVLTKPISREALLDAVARAIPGGR